jgi:hypothetical protein
VILPAPDLPLGLDQLLNCVIWLPGDGWGTADETISARAWRCWLAGLIPSFWYRAIDALFFWQDHHCYHAWRSEIERRQLPDHYQLETRRA